MRFDISKYAIKVNALAVETLLDAKNHMTLQPDPQIMFLRILSQTALFLLFLSLCEKFGSYEGVYSSWKCYRDSQNNCAPFVWLL